MHDSFTPLGGLVPLFLMQFGEVVFGGVGSGLYGMIVFAIMAVFVAGLMVGRTPEYLGKKIEPYEMKMASLIILVMPIIVLSFTAVAVVIEAGESVRLQPWRPRIQRSALCLHLNGQQQRQRVRRVECQHLLLQYDGWSSNAAEPLLVIIPTLALAGSLARKNLVPAGPGTLATHTPLFVVMLIGIVVLVGALTFVPALALGPLVEHLTMIGL